MAEKLIPLDIPFSWFLHTPDVQEILFFTICDVTSESTCNIEYKVFKGPEFISDNYKLIGTCLHGPPDAAPVHQILQHPASIRTGTW